MSKQVSSLFLSDISVIDHAYIDAAGNVVGGSFNPSFLVTGELDPIEQVVVDFSSVKKQIKSIIDDKSNGLDHKLWFIDGYSNGSWVFDKFSGSQAMSMTITTPTTRLTLPRNAVSLITHSDLLMYTTHCIGGVLQRLVETYLRTCHPNANIKVECINNTNCHFPTQNTAHATFRYTHGLKDSTSWGCQNIAHGHLSYIQLDTDPSSNIPLGSGVTVQSVLTTISSELDDTVFIKSENISHQDIWSVTIEYTTDRGLFRATYNRVDYNIVILETETTVEHLVEYVAAKYADLLSQVGCTRLFVSEGLSKGAFVTL